MTSRQPIRKRRKPRRVSVNRDKAYRQFLASEGRCVACAVRPVPAEKSFWARIIDPAHYVPNGKGSKGPDNLAIPLCRRHHDEQTRLAWPNFLLKYGIDRDREVKTWNALYLIWKESQV